MVIDQQCYELRFKRPQKPSHKAVPSSFGNWDFNPRQHSRRKRECTFNIFERHSGILQSGFQGRWYRLNKGLGGDVHQTEDIRRCVADPIRLEFRRIVETSPICRSRHKWTGNFVHSFNPKIPQMRIRFVAGGNVLI